MEVLGSRFLLYMYMTSSYNLSKLVKNISPMVTASSTLSPYRNGWFWDVTGTPEIKATGNKAK